MADVDTECKRRSSMKLIPPLPVADGTISAADRAHVTWNYCGITYSAPGDTPEAIDTDSDELPLVRVVFGDAI